MQDNQWDIKRILTVVLIALIVGKVFGPVGLAVMALIYLWRESKKSKGS